MKRFCCLIISVVLLLTACGGGEVEDTSVPTFEPAGTTAPVGDGKLICEGVAYEHFWDLLDVLAVQGRFEQVSHSIAIGGLSTPVELHMSYGTMTGYTIGDSTCDVDPVELYAVSADIQLDSVVLSEYEGTPILNIWDDVGGITVLMLKEGPWIQRPQDDRSLMVYVDQEGALRCSEESTRFIPSVEHWDTAPIDLAVSRDDFYDARGTCTIDGANVQPVMTEVRTISDAFDLDQIFADAKEAGQYPQFETVDQLLEWNRADRHPEGDPQEEGFWSREEHWEDGTLRSRTTYYRDQMACVQIYDRQGRLTVRGDYDNSGRTKDRYYTYDEDGNCTGYAYSAWGEEQFRYTMTYDAQGRPIQRIRTRSGVPTGVQNYAYSDDGGWTETFTQNGQEKYACRYDADGRLTGHWTYENGVAVETKDVDRLVKAQQVLEVWIPALDTSHINYSFRYDGQDLIYSSASYGSREETSYDGSIHRPLDSTTWPSYYPDDLEEAKVKTVYTYTDGLMTGKKLYQEGELLRSHVYTWEGDTRTEQCLMPDGTVGYVIRQTFGDGKLLIYEEGDYRTVYEYSEDGRTVTKTTFEDGDETSVETSYYDEAGRRIGDWEYIYDGGMLESVRIFSEDYYFGNVMIDWYGVWATPEQAKDLTDTFNEALSWLT